jgi:serine protease Do
MLNEFHPYPQDSEHVSSDGEQTSVTPFEFQSHPESGSSLKPTVSGQADRSSKSPNGSQQAPSEVGAKSLVLSTLLSLAVVLTILVAVRLVLPPLLEWSRYSWHRGELRAEYEVAGEQLRHVSVDGLASVSQMVSSRVVPSVVHITVRSEAKNSLENFFLDMDRDPNEGMLRGQGSGAIIDTDGHILTNNHVLEGATDIEVYLSDNRRAKAKVIGVDKKTDLAVLRIESDNLMPIDWGDSDKITIGTPVWAVGSPFGLTGSITFGIISSKHRISLEDTRYRGSVRGDAFYGDLMQSDVAVNPGNSGGPLVNAQGQLVGVNTAILGESYRGVSFSIPSNVAKNVYEQIIATGKVDRGWIGIRPSMEQLADGSFRARESKEGIIVGGFPSDQESPARESGILQGDLIYKFNEHPIEDWATFRRLISESKVGSTVQVQVKRGDKQLELAVRIASRPDEL